MSWGKVEIVQDETRWILTDDSCSNTMEFVWHDDGSLSVEIDNPWWGSTETGFGATLSMTIPPAQVPSFMAWVAAQGGKHD